MQHELESKYQEQIALTDAQALSYLETDPEQAYIYLTDFACQSGHQTVERWKELSNYLLVKYLDSNVKQEENGTFKRNGFGYPARPQQVGYPDSWKKNTVDEMKKMQVQ